jgi:hypothetical protein
VHGSLNLLVWGDSLMCASECSVHNENAAHNKMRNSWLI